MSLSRRCGRSETATPLAGPCCAGCQHGESPAERPPARGRPHRHWAEHASRGTLAAAARTPPRAPPGRSGPFHPRCLPRFPQVVRHQCSEDLYTPPGVPLCIDAVPAKRTRVLKAAPRGRRPGRRASHVRVSTGPSSRSALKMTSNDTPMSAAIAAQSDANPANVRTTKHAFTASDKVMF